MNERLQNEFVRKKWYLQSTSNAREVLYYITIASNVIRYTDQIDILFVPSMMPSGYTYPDGATWSLPVQPTYPQIILSPGLMKIFGFKSQSQFPPSQTVTTVENKSYLSDTYPVLSPVFAYTLGCNWVNSPFSQDPRVLYSVPLSKSFGELLNAELSNSTLVSVFPRSYTTLDIYIMDQDLNPIVLVDPEISITLILEYDVA